MNLDNYIAKPIYRVVHYRQNREQCCNLTTDDYIAASKAMQAYNDICTRERIPGYFALQTEICYFKKG